MKQLSATFLAAFLSMATMAQHKSENTLLWKITGPGMDKPSYLFGTIHVICKDDAVISPMLRKAIKESDEVYFEVDMDNMFEMLMAVRKMKMRGDTTLKDLLTEKDYEKVKSYFAGKRSILPFSVLETYKPILAASTLESSSMGCESTAMEQVIMMEANFYDKEIRGLESLTYQASILDSIPYKLQADQLVEYIDRINSGDTSHNELDEMFKAYKEQDLSKLEALLMSTDAGISAFADIMLYNRNRNWVEKLKNLLGKKPMVIAVGAGHLPGEKGVINLLRSEGYKLTPVENKMLPVKDI
jgi:uncharacterized protein YbaP (TraB family)